MASSGESNGTHCQSQQNVIVMRHGDRMDNFEPLWITTTERPWDPPLFDAGRTRAFCTARNLRSRLSFPITRAFVSPFLRCVQTAAKAISALCAVDDSPLTNANSIGVTVDSSKIKVSIEYGLCEIMNMVAVRVPPKDGNWGFNLSEIESMFPPGTVDHSVESVYKELPGWEETVEDARSRYEDVILALANKFPQENLLLVTHGEGVGASVAAFSDVTPYDVEYCGYSHLRRTLAFGEDKSSTPAGKFKLVIEGQTGITFA